MSNKLYVGNLSFDTTERDLNDLFSEVGTVTEAILISDKTTGRSRGFGFVTMSDAEGAKAATDKFNGKEVHGRSLTVNEAKDRESTGGGGGGGGGGRGKFGADRRPARRY